MNPPPPPLPFPTTAVAPASVPPPVRAPAPNPASSPAFPPDPAPEPVTSLRGADISHDTDDAPIRYATRVEIKDKGVYLFIHGQAFFEGYGIGLLMCTLLGFLTYFDAWAVGQAQQAIILGVNTAVVNAGTAIVNTVRASNMPVVQDAT